VGVFSSGGSSFPVAGGADNIDVLEADGESSFFPVPRFGGVVGLEVVGAAAVRAEWLALAGEEG